MSAAKWASEMVEGTLRKATSMVTATMPIIPRFSMIGLFCQRNGVSLRQSEKRMAVVWTPITQTSSCWVIHKHALATITSIQAAAGRGASTSARKLRRLMTLRSPGHRL